MKTKFIRILALALACLMLGVAFVSCKKKEEAPVDTTGAVSTTEGETETDIYAGLRGIGDKYKGKEFTILTYDNSGGWYNYFIQEEAENE